MCILHACAGSCAYFRLSFLSSGCSFWLSPMARPYFVLSGGRALALHLHRYMTLRRGTCAVEQCYQVFAAGMHSRNEIRDLRLTRRRCLGASRQCRQCICACGPVAMLSEVGLLARGRVRLCSGLCWFACSSRFLGHCIGRKYDAGCEAV